MKYKVGDKVLVRDDLIIDEKYGNNSFVFSMDPYRNKIVTIASEASNNSLGEYYILEDNGDWVWTDEMFKEKVSADSIPDKTFPKYKIGDKVQIIKNLCEGPAPEKLNILSGMLVYAGEVVTISSVSFEPYGIVYSIKEDNNSYSWPESVLEPIEDSISDYIPCVRDKVLIREDLKVNTYYGNVWFRESMRCYCNTILTITEVNPCKTVTRKNQFTVAENNFLWTSEMVKMKVQNGFNLNLPSKEKNTLPEVEVGLFLVIPKTKPKLFLI